MENVLQIGVRDGSRDITRSVEMVNLYFVLSCD